MRPYRASADYADDLISEHGTAEVMRRLGGPRVVQFGPPRPLAPHIVAALAMVDRAFAVGPRPAPFPPEYHSIWRDLTPQEIEDELEARAVTGEFDRTWSV